MIRHLCLILLLLMVQLPAVGGSAENASPSIELRGAVTQTSAVLVRPDLSRQIVRVKRRLADGTFGAAWELSAMPLGEVLPESVLRKEKEDGFDRLLDLVLVGSAASDTRAVYSFGELYLRSGADPVVLADRFRWLLPHKHPELASEARSQLEWQATVGEPIGFRSACMSCHGAGGQRELKLPRGLILAAVGDAGDGRLLEGVSTIEVRQVPAVPSSKLEKTARETMFIADPGIFHNQTPIGSLSRYLATGTPLISYADDTVGLGKGYHGTHHWQGVDLAALLRQAIPSIEPSTGYLLVTGADGYRCAFSGGELFGGRFPGSVMLVTEEDQKPIGPGKGKYKVISRTDYFIDRAVRSVAELRWLAVQP